MKRQLLEWFGGEIRSIIYYMVSDASNISNTRLLFGNEAENSLFKTFYFINTFKQGTAHFLAIFLTYRITMHIVEIILVNAK